MYVMVMRSQIIALFKNFKSPVRLLKVASLLGLSKICVTVKKM